MVRNNPTQDLHEIRSMMERSSRFISLSGLSGVMAGLYALLGAFYVREHYASAVADYGFIPRFTDDPGFFLTGILCAFAVLLLSIVSGLLLTARRAGKEGQNLRDGQARRMLINLALPLVVGAVFCFALLYRNIPELLVSAMLVFYGLALINCSKYTLNDIRYLGIIQAVLGLLAAFLPGIGIYLWAFGFGIMHIGYGIYMYIKYEKNNIS